MLIDAYFSGTKLKWLLDNVPGARAQAERSELAFGTIDSWLIWQLTGGAVHTTDVSNASRTMLFDVHITSGMPNYWACWTFRHRSCPRSNRQAPTMAKCSPNCWVSPILIGGVAGDQQSALFGQACFKAGMAKENTYGTGCFLLMHTGTHFQTSHNGLLTTSAAQPTAANPILRWRAVCLSAAPWCNGCATA